MNVICGKCGKEYTVEKNQSTVKCPHCSLSYNSEGKSLNNANKSVICPKCYSQQIHAEKRGWKLTTGFLGSGKIIITCLACGYRWQAGK